MHREALRDLATLRADNGRLAAYRNSMYKPVKATAYCLWQRLAAHLQLGVALQQSLIPLQRTLLHVCIGAQTVCDPLCTAL